MSTAMAIAGVDEAGRGPLAGPVVAGAVILGTKTIVGLGDSKAKTARQRERLYAALRADARAVGIGLASAAEIDELNIHHASLLAMARAVANLAVQPDEVLVDGRFTPALPCPTRAIVGGDAAVAAIGAASIVAKVYRDRLMLDLHAEFPAYGFDRHKGYPTAVHLRALTAVGPCPAHRRSYAPVQRVLARGARP